MNNTAWMILCLAVFMIVACFGMSIPVALMPWPLALVGIAALIGAVVFMLRASNAGEG